MRKQYIYKIEKDSEKIEFEKITEVAKHLGCVQSTVLVYMKKNKPYNGWIITREFNEEYKEISKNKVAFNPRNRYSGKNNWKYYKYSCLGNEVICCEKTYFIDNKTIKYDLEDFLNIKELLIKGIEIIFKNYYHSKYVRIPEISLCVNVNKTVEKRMINVQVYVAWTESKRMIDQVNEIEDKILMIDKIVEEYGKRKSNGDYPNNRD